MAQRVYDQRSVRGDDRRAAAGDSGRRPGGQSGQGTTRITGYVYLVGAIAALGGLLFGYDTGVVSGAQGFLKKTFHLSATSQEIAVSAVLIGAVLGAAAGGKLADWLGRKTTLIIAAIIFGVGAILTAIAPSLWLFVAFRILVGLAIGSASVVSPMYSTEMSPPSVRGKLVLLFQLAVTVGILLAYVIDYLFANADLGWRWMFAVGLVPAVLLGVGMFFLTDTPRWLASKDRWDEAKEVQQRIAPDNAEKELDSIRKRLDESKNSSWTEILHGGMRWALLAGFGLAALQQLVGINTIIYYAPIVAGYSGIGAGGGAGGTGSLIGAMIVGAVNVAATTFAAFLVDKFGRRTFLLAGTAGTLLTLTAAGVLFMLDAHGFGIVLLIVILLYIVAFAIGLGPVYWLIASEIFPTRLRGTGSSISTVGNWGFNLIVTITYLTLIAAVGKPVTFWIYAAFSLVALFFIWFMIPETKNRPLEQIEEYWQNGRSWEQAGDTQRKSA